MALCVVQSEAIRGNQLHVERRPGRTTQRVLPTALDAGLHAARVSARRPTVRGLLYICCIAQGPLAPPRPSRSMRGQSASSRRRRATTSASTMTRAWRVVGAHGRVAASCCASKSARAVSTDLTPRRDSPQRRPLRRRRGLSRPFDVVEQLFYHLSMARIGVRELNQRTSQILDRVRRGETLIVTDHGEPVARLVPIGETASILDELISGGKAIPPRFKRPLPPAMAFGDASSDSTEIVRTLRDEA
jgi:prevent-host-death family protein